MQHTAQPRTSRTLEHRRLTVFRRWLTTLVALSIYLILVVLFHYRYELHNPTFVLPNVAVLLGWGVAVSGTLMAWDRLVAARRQVTLNVIDAL